MTVAIPNIEYNEVDLRSIKLTMKKKGKNEKLVINSMSIGGRPVRHSDRFVHSMCTIFGFSPSIFQYFSPDEVIDRIVNRGRYGDQIRITEEVNGNGRNLVLAASRISKPVVNAASVGQLMKDRGATGVRYGDGVITSFHTPAVGDCPFKIGPDQFLQRFAVDTPIDGYGKPNAYVALLREVCSNLSVHIAKAFRSSIQVGKDESGVMPAMARFLDSFNNEEAYAVVRQRFESAMKSPASLDEFYSLMKILCRDDMLEIHKNPVKDDDGDGEDLVRSDITSSLRTMAGNVCNRYGLVSLDSISPKRRAHIPTECSMYDLLNFTSELATHRSKSRFHAMKLNSWIGQTIAGEYDLEGTLEENEDPQDLFLDHDATDPSLN